jgi:hypothetical protein
MVMARLAAADHELAVRALRRHRAWRDAVERGASAKEQRALRRSWQRARDEALVALREPNMSPPDSGSPV